MKRYVSILLILALLLGLSACTKDSETHTTQSPEEPEGTATNYSVEDYVGVFAAEHIAYIDDSGYDHEADFQIPVLLLDSEDARTANEEIQAGPLLSLEMAREDQAYGGDLYHLGVQYDAWIYEHYLTLVITTRGYCDTYGYYTYCFDLTNGELLDWEDYLRLSNLSEEALTEGIRNSLAVAFEENNGQFPKDDFYYDRLAATTEDVNVERAVLYLTETGELGISCIIYAIAGADAYRHLIPFVK